MDDDLISLASLLRASLSHTLGTMYAAENFRDSMMPGLAQGPNPQAPSFTLPSTHYATTPQTSALLTLCAGNKRYKPCDRGGTVPGQSGKEQAKEFGFTRAIGSH